MQTELTPEATAQAEMQNAAHAKDEIDFQDSVDSLMESIRDNISAQAKQNNNMKTELPDRPDLPSNNPKYPTFADHVAKALESPQDRAKRDIAKCETCKFFKIDSTLTCMGECKYITVYIGFEFHCGYHEPKPE